MSCVDWLKTDRNVMTALTQCDEKSINVCVAKLAAIAALVSELQQYF